MHWLKTNRQLATLAGIVLFGIVLWFLPHPKAIQPVAWHLFSIFVATIIGIILKPLPMGAISLLSLAFCTVTNTLSFGDAFWGFSNDVVWLVVFAFFVARGFVATGLGNRMAYKIMSFMGKNSLGLGYGLVATDFLLAPMIPSVTARAGGIIFPIFKALTQVFTGKSHDPKMGGFLTLCAFQGSVITSAMFLTAMAGNPLISEIAKSHGVEISWVSWALAAIVPGLVSLIAVPYFLFRVMPPTIRQTPHAREMAAEKLAEMGPIKPQEWIMMGTFLLMIVLWIVGPQIGIKAAVATIMGLSILLVSGILKWKDILEEQSAWDTFIWFATLVTLANFLNKLGMASWFGNWVVSYVQGWEWVSAFIALSLIYFFTHYFFASNVAHIGAMYAPLFIVAMALGTPPELAALILAFFSNLFGGLTHYGSGPAPIFFGVGYVPIGQWWKIGFQVAIINISIWFLIGGAWWKILGLW
ncbi:MAG: anion permease [Chlamydiia bacterium]|nr:anion permease [Chlamydiia bacterium]